MKREQSDGAGGHKPRLSDERTIEQALILPDRWLGQKYEQNKKTYSNCA
jgi:hypothetical protein